jgi:hypothetical protein
VVAAAVLLGQAEPQDNLLTEYGELVLKQAITDG